MVNVIYMGIFFFVFVIRVGWVVYVRLSVNMVIFNKLMMVYMFVFVMVVIVV